MVLRWFLLKQVEIIGEAAFKLSAALRDRYPNVPWDKISRTRHILVHDYHDVDWGILWNVLTAHLEPLRVQVVEIVKMEHGAQE